MAPGTLCTLPHVLQAQTLPAAALSVPGSGDRVLPSQTGVCVAELEINVRKDGCFTSTEKAPLGPSVGFGSAY